MAITIRTTGLGETNYYIANLGENLSKTMGKKGALGEIAKTIQRRAKLYCPKWSRTLWDSIKIEIKEKDLLVSMNAPYAYFQEYGFRAHRIAGALSTRTGRQFAEWIDNKFGIPRLMALSWIMWVKKPRSTEGHIIGKALRTTVQDMPVLLDKYATKGLKGGK